MNRMKGIFGDSILESGGRRAESGERIFTDKE